mmetsp:Transcript_9421/g.17708  ORF Transcript_9421/g.17708 Transcript_9421/m.17708 type:complete len:84 (-) Transcript_9421:1297-1548(-)
MGVAAYGTKRRKNQAGPRDPQLAVLCHSPEFARFVFVHLLVRKSPKKFQLLGLAHVLLEKNSLHVISFMWKRLLFEDHRREHR